MAKLKICIPASHFIYLFFYRLKMALVKPKISINPKTEASMKKIICFCFLLLVTLVISAVMPSPCQSNNAGPPGMCFVINSDFVNSPAIRIDNDSPYVVTIADQMHAEWNTIVPDSEGRHNPGDMYIITLNNEILKPTLILTWPVSYQRKFLMHINEASSIPFG
jgi:hypothetical protein